MEMFRIFEEKRKAKPMVEKTVSMWLHKRRYAAIVAEPDFYRVLGLRRGVASDAEVHAAYRSRSLRFHPDRKGGSVGAFQRIQAAYETLKSREQRQAYESGEELKAEATSRDAAEGSPRSDGSSPLSLREWVERRYWPEEHAFWPFGDPLKARRAQEEQRRRQREAAQHCAQAA